MNKSKGFTIIELIVVIAIIAVLASIVLVNVTQYIGRGKDAAIQASLAGAVTTGTTFFDTNNTYDSFCSDSAISAVQSSVASAGGNFSCKVDSTNNAWCACSPLLFNNTGVFCVDSTGAKKTADSTDCDTECSSITGACL